MIPLTLTIQGLYSYRSKQTIDFTRLTQAGLFGIFGGVGSGKSAILEAISFALYQESERLNARDGRSYNMMNLKSNELLIDFEFMANDENRYRFTVKGKRNSKKFEDVKTFEWAAYRKESENWLPISPDHIEKITGLNYKNFRRTIIIPQGKFQEFLQLSSSERTTMLKDLFNLSKYELSDKVIGLESKNNSDIDIITGKLQGIGALNPEKITELESQASMLNKLVITMKVDLQKNQDHDQELDILKMIVETIKKQKEHQKELLKSEPDMFNLDKEVREYEKFSLLFKSDIAQFKGIEESISRGSREIDQHKKKQTELNKKSEKIQIEFNGLKKDYDQRETFIRESEEIKKYAEIKELSELVNKLGARNENGKETLKQTADLIESKKEQYKDKSDELVLVKRSLPDVKILSELREWFSTRNNLDKSKQDFEKKTAKNAQDLNELNRQITGQISSSKLFDSIPEETDMADVLEIAMRLKNESEMKSSELDGKILVFEIQNQLESYASELEEGKPCPLCGSNHHPNKLNPQNVAEELEKVKNDKKAEDLKIKKCFSLEKSLTVIHNQILTISKLNEDIQSELEALKLKIQMHEAHFKWPEFDKNKEAHIFQEFDRYEKLQKSILSTEVILKSLTAEIEENEKKKEKYTDELAKIDQQITGNQSKKELLLTQIKLIDMEHYSRFTGKQLIETADLLLQRYEKLSQQYSKTEQALNELKSESSTLTGKMEEAAKNLKALDTQRKTLQEKIDQKLTSAGNIRLKDVEVILNKELDVDTAKAKIESFRQEVESIRKYLSELENQLAGRVYEDKYHAGLKLQIQQTKQSIEDNNKELGRLENEIKRMKVDAERLSLLKTELEKLQLRAQDITELKNLFRASAFVNYVSTVYLQNLCKSANDRFYKLTRQKLGLELTVDNSFEVRDYMNEGKLRSVKTLSGGQTFQASLSLALSLADSIQKIAGSSENFFFLDEGFGTLDKDSLGFVFDTLKALRKENRIVGVISHVEEMQQEIETYLNIINDEQSGSIVHESWK